MKHALFLWSTLSISITGVAQKTTTEDSILKSKGLLEEVVITGYNTATRQHYTGAVSTVKAAQLNDVPVASFDQMLQGRAAGLYVAAGSGQPGAAARVLVRGQATKGGSISPLYVVDGIAVESGAFMTMNPGDFASISVLKDASATALYGSRGANGVIMITTKRGKSGDVVLTFNTQHGVSMPTRAKFDMMNTQQRLQFEEEVGKEYGRNIGPGWRFSPLNPANAALSDIQKARNAAILDSLGNINTHWDEIFLRSSAPFHEYELNASGGTEMIRFYSSANYYKQDGIALRSGIERYSFRTNLDVHSKRFTAAINMAVGYSKNNLIENENAAAITNTFAAVYWALPYEQPYVNGTLVHSGNKALFGGTYDTREGSDALERVQNTTYRVNQLKGALSTNLKYNFTDWLYASSNMGIDYRDNADTRSIRPGSYSGGLPAVPGRQGSLREESVRYYQFTATSGLTFARKYQHIHDITVAGFYEFNRMKSSTYNFTGYGITPGLSGTVSGVTQGSATNGFIPVVGGGKTGTALASWVALARYVYDEKYLLNLVFRRDGSSTVPEKNRWHNFYSIGAGYDIRKESFLESFTWLNTLRLRGSYGTSASPFISNFAYVAGYGATRYDGMPAIAPASVGNENYDWEYSKTLDFGADIVLLKDRIRLIADWYNKRTEGVFIDEQLSQTSGFSTRTINAGVVRNRGVEIDLSGDIVRNHDFTLTAGFNIAKNRNVILSLGGVNEFAQGAYIFRVGESVNSHYIQRWAGVDPKTGKPQYYDKAGNVISTYNPTAYSVTGFGSWDPPVYGGFYTRASWKGLTADVFFSFAQDVYRYNSEEYYTLNSNQNVMSNQSTKWFQRWKKDGDITDQPVFTETRPFTSRDIQDASYIRLRNVQLSYTFPVKMIERTKVLKNATLYIQGQNLLTFTKWTGFDPEDNNGTAFFEYPAARTITAGARIQF